MGDLYKQWYTPTATHLTLYFHTQQHDWKFLDLLKISSEVILFTLSRILEIKTPNRLEFGKKLPKWPLFLWLLWLKDPLFFALHTHGLSEGNVAPSNRSEAGKCCIFRNRIVQFGEYFQVKNVSFVLQAQPTQLCIMDESNVGGQGWYTGYYHPSQTWKGCLQPPSINCKAL